MADLPLPGLRAEPAVGRSGVECCGGSPAWFLELSGRAPQPALAAVYRAFDARPVRSLAGSGAADPVELSPRLRQGSARSGHRHPGQGSGKD